MILRLDFSVRSLNVLLRWHWQTRREHLDQWEWLIKAEFRGLPPRAQGPMKVHITSFRTKLLDKDNLVGGCKPILDALRNQGLIKDDSPEWVEVDYQQVKVNGGSQTKTVIQLEPIIKKGNAA